MNEIWKDIQGYDGIYQISNLGRVKSLPRVIEYDKPNWSKIQHMKIYIPERILKAKIKKGGYLEVNLNYLGSKKFFQIHRLVAQAFIPNPNNLPQVNHKDENTSNNQVDNLEWCSAKYNCNYGNRNKRISEYRKINQFGINNPNYKGGRYLNGGANG